MEHTSSSHAAFTSAHLQDIVNKVSSHLRQVIQQECSSITDISKKDSDLAGDLVTRSDFTIQHRLCEFLTTLIPDSRFLGEEQFSPTDSLSSYPYWIVDPLDGTLNYASSLPFYGSSIALVINNKPILGVVYDSSSDKIYSAIEGQLPMCNERQFTWNKTFAERAPVGISSGYLSLIRHNPDFYSPNLLGHRFRIFGSQSVQLCWAAAGYLRLNINPEAKLWDDAAGFLICTCAGAAYYSLLCQPLYPLVVGSTALHGKSLFSISGDPSLANQLISLLAQQS